MLTPSFLFRRLLAPKTTLHPTLKRSMVRYLDQQSAINIDVELFNEYKFSVDQLMELAGLSCAHAITACYPPKKDKSNVLVVCGPGNNGGDGYVCARHLSLMGYNVDLLTTKETKNELYNRLIHQCSKMGLKFIAEMPNAEKLDSDYNIVVDAVFGFSFKPPIREAFVPIIESMSKTKTPLVSIDIPSGWDVERGDIHGTGISPKLLVSLTAPKNCAKLFQGPHHYLGGRFVPNALQEKYKLDLPEYPGHETCVKL